MKFVLVMAGRELKASWRRLLFFFVCIAIGVGSIVALRSVIQSVRIVLAREARTLMAADVTVSTNRPWDGDSKAKLDAGLLGAPVLGRTETVETPTMVRPADPTKTVAKMVELRAVQPGFPFYGTLTLESGVPYTHRLLEGQGALVRPELLVQLGISVGDAIIIGSEPFTIRGVIGSEPGRQLGAFTLGPRVLIDYDDLPATGLLGFGSRARHQLLLRVADAGIDPLVERLRAGLRETFVSVRSYRATENRMGENMDRAENYLSLVGLVIVVLGGIGVSSVTRVFMQQKIKTVAVLKCLGASAWQILTVYVAQVLALGLAGSVLGVGMAAVAIAAIPRDLGQGAIGADVTYGMTASAIAQGLSVGMIVSLLFAIVPLLEVRQVKPSLLLRQGASPSTSDWVRIAAMVVLSLALVGLAAWQAASLKIGLSVAAGFAGVSIVLHLAGYVLVRLVRPLAHAPSFALRHAVLHVTRPGNQTAVILLAVGLGSFFIIGIRGLQQNLLREFALEVAQDSPDMFLIDIQRDQVEPMRAFLAASVTAGPPPRLIPVLRARITGVEGQRVVLEGLDEVRERGSLAREYTVTYRDRLEDNERIVEGAFWSGAASAGEVSIEESIRDRFRIDVGDQIRFDILGRVVTARVSSVRHVEWRESRTGGFMFVFRPGLLDQAPHTFIAPVKGPSDMASRARVQHDLVEQFPNVSVIDLREILETARGVIGNVTLALTVVGVLVVLTGVLILTGAVAMTKFQRVYEAAILKTLGASSRLVATMLVLEYGVLGTLAGGVGSFGAILLTWAVSRYALEITWAPAIGENVAGMLLTGLLVTGIGVAASYDVLRRKPLASLRAE